MNDIGYGKNIFDAWYSGLTDADVWEELGIKYRTYYEEEYSIPVNHGFSKEICMPTKSKSEPALRCLHVLLQNL